MLARQSERSSFAQLVYKMAGHAIRRMNSHGLMKVAYEYARTSRTQLWCRRLARRGSV
jgi:hypothetical protein